MRYRQRVTSDEAILREFWAGARAAHPELSAELPEAWSFGATPEHADGLLELVLAGAKTATASALGDYETDEEQVPRVGELSIILDGTGAPSAVLEVTAVDIVPFAEVTAEHARAEGEDDRSLESWRRIHEEFWQTHSAQGYHPEMLVVCETFRLVHHR